MAHHPAAAGKKKKRKKEASAPVAEAAVEVKDAAEKPAKESPEQDKEPSVALEGSPAEPSDRAYRAAAVAFFTRNARGEVDKVLVALEERKIPASLLGLDQKGKVNEQVIVFPMGRREKKDKNDCVETAKREYVEETSNFGGLAKYLDFADFEGDDAVEERDAAQWTGKKNLALFFSPASMVVLFCEVPTSAAARATDREGDETSAPASEPPVSATDGVEVPTAKKRRKGDVDGVPHKPSPNYHVGKTDHLQPFWIDALDLRRVIASGDKAPLLQVQGKECRFFPTNVSALKLPEARAWLGLPLRSPESEPAK